MRVTPLTSKLKCCSESKRPLRIALMLFALAVVFRLPGIGSETLQIDEIHWKNRGEAIRAELSEGRYRTATSFLEHPGVTPALIIAVTQRMAIAWNSYFGFAPDHRQSIDLVSASRFACAITVCFFVPLIFLLFRHVVGDSLALIAAALFSVEPMIVGTSRLAHLDSVMAVFVTISASLYFFSLERRSLGLKLVSGAVWGLALLAKATAVLLPVAFIFYRSMIWLDRRWRRESSGLKAREDSSYERGLFHWSDIWALFVGHVIFLLLHTRNWLNTSEYRWRLNVPTEIPDLVFALGAWLYQDRFIILPCAITLLFVTGYRAYQSYARGWDMTGRGWLWGLAAPASGLIILLTFWPPLVENLTFFWLYVGGLHDAVHESIGFTAPPVAGRYLGILGLRLTPLVIIALIVGTIALLVRHRSFESSADRFLWFSLAVSLVWIALLSTSEKQAFRYVMPIFPFFLLLSARGVVALFAMISRPGASRFREVSTGAALCLHISLCAYFFYRTFPDTLLYYNSLGGGLRGAIERQEPIPFAGTDAGIHFLRGYLKPSISSPAIVGLVSDVDAVEQSERRLYPIDPEAMRFRPITETHYDELVWAFHPIELQRKDYPVEFRDVLFEYEQDGVVLYRIGKATPLSFDEPFDIPIVRWRRNVGDVRLAGQVSGTSTASRSKVLILAGSSRGHAFFGDGLRLDPGRYRFRISGALLRSSLDPAWRVLEFKFGSECERSILSGEFAPDNQIGRYNRVEFDCEFAEPYRRQITAFWNGRQPLSIESLTVQRISSPATN